MKRNEFNVEDVQWSLERIGEKVVGTDGTEMTRPIVKSCGVGRDSIATLLHMHEIGIRPDMIIFSDVGGEHPYTYATLIALDEWCKSVGFPEVTVTSYYSPTTRYQSLEGNCLCNMTLPSLAFNQHSCSLKWKIEAIEDEIWGIEGWEPAIKALEQGVTVTRLIGYDYGCADSKRFAKVDKIEKKEISKGKFMHWRNRYPLREWQMTREDLQAVYDRHPEFGDLMETHTGRRDVRKSSCFFCPAAKVEEVEELGREYPDLALRVAVMEYRAETGKHGFQKVNGIGLGTAPGQKKIKGRRNWNWTKHLVAKGLLPKNWLELAYEKELLPSDWAEFSAKCAKFRERVETARQAEFDAAAKLPAEHFDAVYPPKKRYNKKLSERDNRGKGREGVKKNIEKLVAGTPEGDAYIEARKETKRAERAKRDLIAIDWKRIPKPKPTKEVKNARRVAKKRFREAISRATKLCAVTSDDE